MYLVGIIGVPSHSHRENGTVSTVEMGQFDLMQHIEVITDLRHKFGAFLQLRMRRYQSLQLGNALLKPVSDLDLSHSISNV